MFELIGYPNGTVIRVTSDRFGPGRVGAIGTITDRYPSGIDGLAYAVILEGSPAGTFHQCGAADFEVVPRGTEGNPFTEGKAEAARALKGGSVMALKTRAARFGVSTMCAVGIGMCIWRLIVSVGGEPGAWLIVPIGMVSFALTALLIGMAIEGGEL